MNISHFYGFNVFMDFEKFDKNILIISLDEENKKALYSLEEEDFIQDDDLSKVDKEVILDWIHEHLEEIIFNFKNKIYNKISGYTGD